MLLQEKKKLSSLLRARQKGNAMLALLPFILLLYSTLLGFTTLNIKAQNQMAELFRLDVCARKVSSSRANLFRKLTKINLAMRPLQYAVYISRGMKVIPGAGVIAQVSEASALTSLKYMASSQNFLITVAHTQEVSLLKCNETLYSKSLAYCRFPIASLNDFEREKALFPDVPGRIALRDKTSDLLKVHCSLPGSLINSSVRLVGSKELASTNYQHIYEK